MVKKQVLLLHPVGFFTQIGRFKSTLNILTPQYPGHFEELKQVQTLPFEGPIADPLGNTRMSQEVSKRLESGL